MDKKEIIDFFNKLAPSWDDMQIRNEAVIAEILQKAVSEKVSEFSMLPAVRVYFFLII